MSSASTAQGNQAALEISTYHEKWLRTELISKFGGSIERFFLEMAVARTRMLWELDSVDPVSTAMEYWTSPEKSSEGEKIILSEGEETLISDLMCLLDINDPPYKHPSIYYIICMFDAWMAAFVAISYQKEHNAYPSRAGFTEMLLGTMNYQDSKYSNGIETFVKGLELKQKEKMDELNEKYQEQRMKQMNKEISTRLLE